MEKEIKILIAGDFCPKDRVASRIGTPTSGEILHDMEPIIKSCDLAIVNLECPLVTSETQPIVKEGPSLKSIPDAANLLKDSGFSLATMANNHILDYGEVGLTDTINALKKADISRVGAGINSEDAKRVYYFRKNSKTIAIINCCEHEFSIATDNSAGANPLNPVQQWYDINEAKRHADYVIVIVHGGHEHYSLPSPRMQETYRFFIDAGADAVINHHQHCYSGYEVYNGRPIFYGLGNFCFDWEGKRDSKWNYGYMVELHFDTTIRFTLYPYEQCNKTPDIRLLNFKEKKQIEQNIQALNAIIKSPSQLQAEHNKWIRQDERNWLISIFGARNRYIQALMRHGYLPFGKNQNKIKALLNKVTCESHRDKLIQVLKAQL